MRNIDFLALLKSERSAKESLRRICLRRDYNGGGCQKCEFFLNDTRCEAYIAGADELAEWLFQERKEEDAEEATE